MKGGKIMDEKFAIKLFDDYKIRTKWDFEIENYYYSVIDIIAVLTQSKDPSAYWRKLKQRLSEESNESVTNCHRLKMSAKDGNLRLTDVANTKELSHLIQSVPLSKMAPFKFGLV